MDKLIRLFVFVVLLVLGGFIVGIVVQRKAEIERTPTKEQLFRAEDQRLLDTLVDHQLTEEEVQVVPSYTDVTRELQKGVLAYVRARARMNRVLSANYDLLQRYPPAGVPANRRNAYLLQNAGWMKTAAQGTNDQIRALKNFQGDIEAFFLSHPEDQAQLGSAVSQRIGSALQKLKPGAKLIKALGLARKNAASKPSVVTVARFDEARAAFDRWRESI